MCLNYVFYFVINIRHNFHCLFLANEPKQNVVLLFDTAD